MYSRSRSVALGVIWLVTLPACRREQRDLRPAPGQVTLFGDAAIESTLNPGGKQPLTVRNPSVGKAYDISEGQRLFDWYNCSGCHSHGGGGIGPPLIKSDWIYGGEDANLFDTIVKGRPNGMPTWGGRIPENQIWEIVAYVRSLNHQEPQSASSKRLDTIEKNPATLRGQEGNAK